MSNHSIERIGRSIYPFRIFGFALFAISVCLSYSKQGLSFDGWAITGLVICAVYPQAVFIRYLRNETRETEISHMFWDMGFQGILVALVNFTPSIVLPYILANSAANFSLRGSRQAIKSVLLSIGTALLVGYLAGKSLTMTADPIELIAPYLYLTAVIHYMGYLSYVRGIALIKRQKQANEQAQLDFLTGLNNRRSVFKKLEVNDGESHTFQDQTTLIMIDLDHFKQVNDRYGHDHGDAVLVEVSSLLRESLRSTDVIARWGGEEFLVLLPNTENLEGMKIAAKIRENIANRCIHFQGVNHQITATLGVASYGANTNFEATLSHADKALYEGKKQGRNRVVEVTQEVLLTS
ncbi:MAG: GGDEF domain-containing protein [Halioglobus sp.]